MPCWAWPRSPSASTTANHTFTHILQAGQHLLGVINDVLDFSKIEAGKLDLQIGRVDITELIDKAVGMVVGQARSKGLSLRVSRDPLLAEAYAGDPVRIAQLLINLLINAVKFTDAGKVELVLRAQQGGVAITVSDTGPGMRADTLSRLFRPFEQGDGSITRKVGGTGLGLSICHRLVDLMQGRIQVHSTPGQGSVFEVWLPLTPMLTHHVNVGGGSSMSLRGLPGAAWQQRLQGVHVLVAEDHPINQLVLQQLLQAEGASYAMVANGALAVDAVKEALAGGQPPFDVLLCDIEMPVMDGYEATRLIRACAPDLPIIGLTAHAFDDARRRGEAVGMSAYLTKPYMVEDLVQAIRQLLPQLAQPQDEATAGQEAPGDDIAPGMRLDRQALAAHYHTVPDFIPSLLAMVADACETQPAQLAQAYAAGEVDRLRHLAHGVLGLAANLLVPDLRATAQDLQEAALHDWEQAGTLVAQLNAGLDMLYRQLRSPPGTVPGELG
jgi:CheY-like chemotaxis protein/HPt (histidine-containing phosphotransfer) domain-containing protein/anti-sigma regulatory factor (Ser/Thr protein kinase)